MRTYQKQYGGRFVRHLVYHRVEESWYRELSQICHSARMSLCLCASENQAFEGVHMSLSEFLRPYFEQS